MSRLGDDVCSRFEYDGKHARVVALKNKQKYICVCADVALCDGRVMVPPIVSLAIMTDDGRDSGAGEKVVRYGAMASRYVPHLRDYWYRHIDRIQHVYVCATAQICTPRY